MNLHLNINDVVTWLLASGFLFALYFKVISPALHQHIATQNASKARDVEELLITLCDTAVKGLSVVLSATGADKKTEAIKRVQSALADKGITIDAQRIADTVERSYQEFAQTNAPALAANRATWEQQSAATSQMAVVSEAPESSTAANSLDPRVNAPVAGTVSPVETAAANGSEATTNGQPV